MEQPLCSADSGLGQLLVTAAKSIRDDLAGDPQLVTDGSQRRFPRGSIHSANSELDCHLQIPDEDEILDILAGEFDGSSLLETEVVFLVERPPDLVFFHD